MDNVSTTKPLKDTPVIRIDSSPAATVRDCITYPGTDIFLSASPDEMKNVVMKGNITNNAKLVKKEINADYWKKREPATE